MSFKNVPKIDRVSETNYKRCIVVSGKSEFSILRAKGRLIFNNAIRTKSSMTLKAVISDGRRNNITKMLRRLPTIDTTKSWQKIDGDEHLTIKYEPAALVRVARSPAPAAVRPPVQPQAVGPRDLMRVPVSPPRRVLAPRRPSARRRLFLEFNSKPKN